MQGWTGGDFMNCGFGWAEPCFRLIRPSKESGTAPLWTPGVVPWEREEGWAPCEVYFESLFAHSCLCVYKWFSTSGHMPSCSVLISSTALLPLTRSLCLYFEHLSQVVMQSFKGQVATLGRSSYQYFRIVISLKRRELMEGLFDYLAL